MAEAWEDALPDAVLEIELDTVPVMAQTVGATDWRIEVTANGRYWQWRAGRGQHRKSRYGGKFDQLSVERKAAYYENRRTKARTPAAAAVDASR